MVRAAGASTKRMNSANISHAGMIFSGLLKTIGLGARNVEGLVDHVAARVFAAADGKFVVADAHFDVVGLTGENRDASRSALSTRSG